MGSLPFGVHHFGNCRHALELLRSNNSTLLCHITCVRFSFSYQFILLDSIQFHSLQFD